MDLVELAYSYYCTSKKVSQKLKDAQDERAHYAKKLLKNGKVAVQELEEYDFHSDAELEVQVEEAFRFAFGVALQTFASTIPAREAFE